MYIYIYIYIYSQVHYPFSLCLLVFVVFQIDIVVDQLLKVCNCKPLRAIL